MARKKKTNQMLTIFIILGIIFVLGVVLRFSGVLSIGLEYTNNVLFDVDYEVQGGHPVVLVSALSKAADIERSGANLVLLYYDDIYLGYREAHFFGANAIHRQGKTNKYLFNLTDVDLSSGYHYIKARGYSTGYFAQERRDNDAHVDPIINSDCLNGEYNLSSNYYYEYQLEWFSKIPCDGFSNTTDPYPIMLANNATFLEDSIELYIEPTVVTPTTTNTTTTTTTSTNTTTGTTTTTTNTTTNTTDTPVVDVTDTKTTTYLIWGGAGFVVFLIIIFFLLSSGKKKGKR